MTTQIQSTEALNTASSKPPSGGAKAVKVRSPHFLKIASALFRFRRQPEFGFDEWQRIERMSVNKLPRHGSEYIWLRGS